MHLEVVAGLGGEAVQALLPLGLALLLHALGLPSVHSPGCLSVILNFCLDELREHKVSEML